LSGDLLFRPQWLSRKTASSAGSRAWTAAPSTYAAITEDRGETLHRKSFRLCVKVERRIPRSCI
jgi:hypothetical protein